jgi:N-acetylmuramoyl-L-alanine amidase
MGSGNLAIRTLKPLFRHISPQVAIGFMYIMAVYRTRAISLAKVGSPFLAMFRFAIRLAAMGALLCLNLPTIANAAETPETPPVVLSLAVSDSGISLETDRKTEITVRHLANPPRVILDLPEADFAISPKDVGLPAFAASMRFGRFGAGHTRIVFAFSMPMMATALDGQGKSGPAERHEFLFQAIDEAKLAALVESEAAGNAPALGVASGAGSNEGAVPETGFTLVIDPGHGGIDGGAEGKLGTIEKDITFAFAIKLRDALANTPGLNVILTRNGDDFVSLAERVATARQHAADLLLSIHGDSIGMADLRGATVYTLSDSASDAVSRALAEQENLSDQIAGLPPEQPDPSINTILVDFLQRETATFSHEIAKELVIHLQKNGVKLINNPQRAAGFRVLTAPDVPSILLELGYLSNIEDEKLMLDEAWRRRTAAVIAEAIKVYAAAHNLNAAKQ